MSIPYSAGALYSTVEDLQRWDSALHTEKLVPARSLDMMFQPRVKMDGPPGAGNPPQYAYGWVIENWTLGGGKQNVRVIGHGGGINGFNTMITRLPSDHRLIVILSNANGGNWEDASKNAAAILYGDRVKLPKALIAGPLYDTLKARGITAAVTRYRELKSNHAQDYDFDEPVLDQLGHQLLERKKVREAIEIFKLNVEAYPASANAYDSLGEAYKSAGERELAIQNYRKALEMKSEERGCGQGAERAGSEMNGIRSLLHAPKRRSGEEFLQEPDTRFIALYIAYLRDASFRVIIPGLQILLPVLVPRGSVALRSRRASCVDFPPS